MHATPTVINPVQTYQQNADMSSLPGGAPVYLTDGYRTPTGSFDEGDPHELEVPNL